MQDFVLVSIPESSIRNIVEQAVRKAFLEKADLETSSDKSDSKIVDLNGLLEARPFVGSRSTIYKKASLGLIPHAKQGKKLFFHLEEIDQWLLAHRVKSPSQIHEEAKEYLKRNNKKGGRS